MATVTQEMVLLRIEDLGAFAEARALLRVVKELAAAARRREARDALDGLVCAATALVGSVAAALRAGNDVAELARLRDASLAAAALRGQAFDAFAAGALPAPRFDELMAGTARCRNELAAQELAARRRALRRVHESV